MWRGLSGGVAAFPDGRGLIAGAALGKRPGRLKCFVEELLNIEWLRVPRALWPPPLRPPEPCCRNFSGAPTWLQVFFSFSSVWQVC